MSFPQRSCSREGVERESQLAILRSYGCDEYQGYLNTRPIPAENFVQLLPAGNRS